MPIVALIVAIAAAISFGVVTIRESTKKTLAWLPFGFTLLTVAFILNFWTVFHVVHWVW